MKQIEACIKFKQLYRHVTNTEIDKHKNEKKQTKNDRKSEV